MSFSSLKELYTVKTTGQLKTLELTDEQYRRLVHLTNVGHRTIVRDNNKTEIGFTDIQQYVMSFSNVFNSSDLVTYHSEAEWYLPSETLNNLTDDVIDYYKEHILIYELSSRLTQRDIELTIDYEDADVEDVEQRQTTYWDEFDKNGYKNLWLEKNNA